MEKSLITRTIEYLLNRIFPSYLTAQIVFELGALKTRMKQPFIKHRFKNKKNLLVNIGAGETGKAGWINVDLFYSAGINCLWDCRKSLPFDNNSVKVLFTEHFFEHLDVDQEAPLFLAECKRVLAPDGIIRIIIPDAEKYLRGYADMGWETLTKTRPLKQDRTDYYSGKMIYTKLELVNIIFRQEYQHKYAYDFPTLRLLLEKNGFNGVVQQEFGKSLLSHPPLDIPIRSTESLYVEAVK